MTTAVHQSPKLLDQMRNKLRVMHYAWNTEQTCVMWIERFLRFYRERGHINLVSLKIDVISLR